MICYSQEMLGEEGMGGQVDTIQTTQKWIAGEQRNKHKPKNRNRNKPFQSDMPEGWAEWFKLFNLIAAR